MPRKLLFSRQWRQCMTTRSLTFRCVESRSLWKAPAPPLRACQHRLYSSISAAELQFGQPLHETHPHILKAGELSPGITALEYAHRRSKLASKLPKHGVAVLASSELQYKSGNVFYSYHQDPDFFYLTGFNEPGALAIIQNDGSEDNHTFHLYVREKDPKAELWDGARSGVQAAMDVFNADESGDIQDLSLGLPSIITDATEIYTDIKPSAVLRSPLSRLFQKIPNTSGTAAGYADPSKFKPLRSVMNDLRAFKSDAEIQNMRKAGQASGRAFTEAMRHGFTREKDLYSFLSYQFEVKGCDTSAFVPVVAGGRNALSIHYVRNDDVLRDGELVLVDGGGEYGGYISDITRTWPVNGKFSGPQRDLYTALLNVQRSCVSLCRESAGLSLDKLHEISEFRLRDELKSLGFDISGNAMTTLFPHHLGHYIGLDVHDCVGYPRRHQLLKGQCITIEPGVYVPNDERWPEQFRGIGIRIEDSVCIGDDNPLVLTTEAVKEIDDIEALR
ncbi:hypothetical protein AJ80_07255 [Polytolypa hystricis UAMH7299]|uniref:Xaa-Pro aminopeptidase n=1 Tax=Polytolypa hystricis (strain UAMH7299) TaxID=1447883 RepID=A0A2B7XQW5_POLH7|nr:hypothetical protein AJ80_07255 [Polytolypa hystricis UAMH7299]